MIATNKKKRLPFPALLMIGFVLAFTGCSSGGQKAETNNDPSEKAPAVDTTPVKLRVFLQQPVSDQDVNSIWVDSLKKKYPHLSLEILRAGNSVTLESMIASGDIPDIIYAFNGILPQYYLQDLLMDMTPLIKRHRLDLSRFDPAVMQSISAISKEGTVIALPFTHQFTALYYNKSLFDRFGVAYPKDGLYWDEAVELAKKMSRKEGTVAYAGLDVETTGRVARPLAALNVDGKTDKASVNTEAWRKAFDLVRTVYTIPNNERPSNTNSLNRFMKDQTAAMLGTVNILAQGLEDAMKQGLDWDLAQYPSYRDLPNVSTIVDSHVFTITKTSKVQDQAMLALDVFTSDEVQLKSTRMTGRLTVLNNPDIRQQLGKEMAFLQGKRLDSVFKGKIIASPPFSKYEFKVSGFTTESMYKHIAGTDVNTALRETEERINSYIASQ